MKLDKIVSWYQRKISTYDIQQWEKTIEQRILHDFVQVPMTNTELKTELIDVDLVRGSSFPKAKPKQGFGTVLKLAFLRYFLLPLYARWWVEQTSPRVFTLLLCLYGLQMWCWGVYSYNIHRIESGNADQVHIVSTIDLMIPMALSLIMSMMHSQIVATASIPSNTSTVNKRSALLTSAKRRHRRRPERLRRKRKVTGHRRGSELKYPLIVDLAHPINLGTIYIHHPQQTAVVAEQIENDVDSIAVDPSDISQEVKLSELNVLRKRIVNFSNNSKASASEAAVSAAVFPDVVRSSRTQSTNTDGGYAEDDSTKEMNAVSEDGAKSHQALPDQDSSEDTDDVDDGVESPSVLLESSNNATRTQFTEGTTSAAEWIGITTNSEEENSYTSELDASDSRNECSDYAGDCDFAPTVILNPCCGINDRISCTIWEHNQTKKAEMSVLDISSAIIERVDAIPDTCEYVYIGLVLSIMLSMVPIFCRMCEAAANMTNSTELHVMDIPLILMENMTSPSFEMLKIAFGNTMWEQNVLIVSFMLRICLTLLFFFVLAVAERTFKQRFLYAKLFSHLTSSRRARKSKVPHFRLNKVRNIKIWLSVRSYLKRRGPQRSVDVIVSAAFILCLLFLSFLSVEWLKDSVHLQSQYNLEALTWSCCLGCFLLRFMTLGTKITRKYRSLSVLITEQINLYLQIEQKPHKKEELMVANSVLKLAADLLKELESPFKISGLSANPYLYTTIKVVILSALSGVLSEMLGFKLKLHKIKIK